MKLVVSIMLAAVAVSACGKSDEAAAPPADASAAMPDTTAQSKTPPFAETYTGAQVSNWVELGDRSGMYSFETADTPAQVAAFYSAAGGSAGLSPRETGGAPDLVYSASGTAGEITVAAPVASGKTSVTVTWTKPAP